MQKCFDFMSDIPEDLLDHYGKRSLYESFKSVISDDLPDKEQRLINIKDRIIETKKKEIKNSVRGKWINEVKKAEAIQRMSRFKNPVEGMKADLVAIPGSLVKGSGNSASNAILSDQAQYLGRLTKNLRKANVYDSFIEGNNETDEATGLAKGDLDLATALWKEEDAPTENSRIIAKVIHDTHEELRILRNRYGADIGYHPDFITNRRHNIERMLRPTESVKENTLLLKNKNRVERFEIARKRWKDDIVPRINIDKLMRKLNIFDKKNIDGLMNDVYSLLVHGKESGIVKGNKNLANSISQHRLFDFNSAEDELGYINKYGNGNLRQSIIDGIVKSARDLTLLKRYGPNFRDNIEDIKSHFINEHKSDQPLLPKDFKSLTKYLDTIDRSDAIPHSHMLAKVERNISIMQNLGKLGNVFYSLLADPAEGVSALRSHGMNIFQRYNAVFENMMPGGKALRKLVGDCTGMGSYHALGEFNSSYMDADTAFDKIGKFQNRYFKLNLVSAWDHTLREGMGVSFGRKLAKSIGTKFENLPKVYRYTLGRYEIDDKIWSLFQENKSVKRAIKSKYVITPDMVHEFSDESMAKYLGKDSITPQEFEDTARDIQHKMGMFYMDQTDMTQMRQTEAERALLLQGSRPGTVWGTIARQFSKFKSFPLGVTRRSIGRIIKEGEVLGKAHVAKGLLDFTVSAFIFGYVATAAKQLSKTGTMPNPLNIKTDIESMVEGGGFGLMGSYMLAGYDSFGKSFVKDLAGPGGMLLDDVAKLFATLGQPWKKHYANSSAKEIVHFWHSEAYINTFYTKFIMNIIYAHVMDHLEPGYIRKQKRSAEKRERDEGDIHVF